MKTINLFKVMLLLYLSMLNFACDDALGGACSIPEGKVCCLERKAYLERDDKYGWRTPSECNEIYTGKTGPCERCK